jgi:hypothetical protein
MNPYIDSLPFPILQFRDNEQLLHTKAMEQY